MLAKGDIYRTNYSDKLFKVVAIINNCKCPRFSDEMGYTNSGMENESPEHFHVISIDLDDNRKSGHGGYAFMGNKILSVWTGDEIIITKEKKNKQLSLF